jgi:peptide/nickel transport system substrate-binding protein
MKRQIMCLPFAYLISMAFLITSCGSSTVTTTVSKTTVPTVKDQTTATQADVTQYGGTLTFISVLDVGIFDGIATGQALGPVAQLVNEGYLEEDWTRGPAGTGEFNWVPNVSTTPDTCMNMLAKSWEIPEPGTVVYQVRRGVHWALNPKSEASRLMNGREVTADDWIASFDYKMNPFSYMKAYVPQLFGTASWEKTGPWEVTLKTPADLLVGWNWLAKGWVFPTEIIAKYGNMQDWHNVVGTGAFMLTDYVPESSATLVRNHGYWQKDPVGPGKGNQLPYLDGVKILVVIDISTMAAALRTAKVDYFTGVDAPDARSILQYNPGIMHSTYMSGLPYVIRMRNDRADLPYRDKKVRQALMLATDFNALKDDYYEGYAETLAFPVSSEAKQVYMPLDEMPESAQALYRYNPEKARQLLAEAQYPDGFTSRMIYWSEFDFADMVSVLQAMWAKAGITLEPVPKETATFLSIAYSSSYEDMLLAPSIGGSAYPNCLTFFYFKSPNPSYFNDAVIEAAYKEVQKHVIVDMPEANRLFRELMPYTVEQSYYIPLPSPQNYSLWWPWLTNYHGETPIQFAKYWWIDRDLKEEMTGRR